MNSSIKTGNKGVRRSLIEEERFEQRLEGGKGVNQGDNQGKDNFRHRNS